MYIYHVFYTMSMHIISVCYTLHIYIYIYIRTFKEMDAPKNMDTSRSLARISER